MWHAEQVFQRRVPGLPEPESAFGVEVRRAYPEVAAGPRLGGDEIESGHDVDRGRERSGDAGHFAGETAQDAADLAVLLALEDGPLGTEVGNAGRLDEHRLARAAGAVNDALKLMPVV